MYSYTLLWTFTVLVIAFASRSSKKHSDTEHQFLDNEPRQIADEMERTCQYDDSNAKISLKAIKHGFFEEIDRLHSKSLDECHELCCQSDECTDGMSTPHGTCFLYECVSNDPENECLYAKANNVGYTTFTKDVQKSPDVPTKLTRRTTTVVPSVSTTELPENYEPSETCRSDEDCRAIKGFCHTSSHTCICDKGRELRNGLCRQICSSIQFQCENKDPKKGRNGPDCIAIYNRCDSVHTCPDGSDEDPEMCIKILELGEDGSSVTPHEHVDGEGTAVSAQFHQALSEMSGGGRSLAIFSLVVGCIVIFILTAVLITFCLNIGRPSRGQLKVYEDAASADSTGLFL